MKHQSLPFQILVVLLLFIASGAAAWAQNANEESAGEYGFSLTKIVSNLSVESGQSFTYHINFSIPAGATDVMLRDVIPTELEIRDIDYSGLPCQPTLGMPLPAVGSLGGTIQFEWASVPDGCAGMFSVTVAFPYGTTCPDIQARNLVYMEGDIGPYHAKFETRPLITTAIAEDPWYIQKSVVGAANTGGNCPYAVAGDPVNGSTVTYKICVGKQVGSTGQLNLANAIVTDVLPSGASYVTNSASCSNLTYDPLTHTITWNVGDLDVSAPYNQVCCTFDVHYPASFLDQQTTNQASLAGVLGSVNDPCGTGSYQSNTVCVEFVNVVSAKLTKYVYTSGQPGCSGKYRIYVGNNGNVTLNALTVEDNLPGELSQYAIGSSNGLVPVLAGTTFSATLSAPLAPGATAYVDIEFMIPTTATVGATVNNCAVLKIPGEPDLQKCVSFVVKAPEPQVCIRKRICNKQANYSPGDIVRFRLQVQNIGGQDLLGGSITDVLNQNLEYIDGSESYHTATSWNVPCQTISTWTGVTASRVGQTVTFSLPTIPKTCQDFFSPYCGSYGNAGVPFYFVEFDVRIADSAAVGNIPNIFTIAASNLGSPKTSNTQLVTVSGSTGFVVDKALSIDGGTTWASSVITTQNTVDCRLHLKVSSSGIPLRHITFVDELPNNDNGSYDEHILTCLDRGSQFDLRYQWGGPMVHGFRSNSQSGNMNTYAIGIGSPPMHMFGNCTSVLNDWVELPPLAGDQYFGTYYGPKAFAAGSDIQYVFQAELSGASNGELACNTFAANGACRYSLNNGTGTPPYTEFPIGAGLESAKVCLTFGTPVDPTRLCDSLDVSVLGVDCTGKDASGASQYDISIVAQNYSGSPQQMWFAPYPALAPVKLINVTPGASSHVLTYTDVPPQDMITCFGWGHVYGGNRFECDTFCVIPPPCDTCIVPPDSMVGWWPGDQHMEDITGNDNHGSWNAGGTESYVTGKVDHSFSFSSTSDFVTVPDAAELNFDVNDFSIDAWVKTAGFTGILPKTIVEKRGGVGGNPVGYMLFIYENKLSFQLGDGSANINHISSALVADDAWHHVAATVDRNVVDGGRLYVDGALVHTFNPTTKPLSVTNTADVFIGAQGYDQYLAFDGQIDEVELFSRVLTPAEILALYEADSYGKCKDTSITTVTLCGEKYHDENMNGVRDPGEPGIEGWQVEVTAPGFQQQTTTDANGQYCFDGIPAGTYTIAEVQQMGWVKTQPAVGMYYLTVPAGSVIDTLVFGNWKIPLFPCDSTDVEFEYDVEGGCCIRVGLINNRPNFWEELDVQVISGTASVNSFFGGNWQTTPDPNTTPLTAFTITRNPAVRFPVMMGETAFTLCVDGPQPIQCALEFTWIGLDNQTQCRDTIYINCGEPPNSCDLLLVDGKLECPGCCDYEVVVNNTGSDPVLAITYHVTGGVVDGVVGSGSCIHDNGTSTIGAASGVLNYPGGCVGISDIVFQTTPTADPGTITLYLDVMLANDTCTYCFTYTCDSAKVWTNPCCDTVQVTEREYPEEHLSERIFTVYNTLGSDNKITYIDIEMLPTPCTINGGSGRAKDDFANAWEPLYGNYAPDYSRIPSSGHFQDVLSSGLNADIVEFARGVDYYCSPPWTGVLKLTIHHEDGSICYFEYDPWEAIPPVTDAAAVASAPVSGNVFALSLQLTASTEQSLCCESSIMLSLNDPAYIFLSGTGRWLPSSRAAQPATMKHEISAHYQNDNLMLFRFDHPLGLGQLSPQLNIFVRGDTTTSAAPTVRWSTFDEHHNVVRTGEFKLVTTIRTIGGEDGQMMLPNEIRLLNFFPNPVTGRGTINYALGSAMNVRLELHNELGALVRTVEHGWKESGTHSVSCDTHGLPSGNYFIKLSSNEETQTRQITVVK